VQKLAGRIDAQTTGALGLTKRGRADYQDDCTPKHRNVDILAKMYQGTSFKFDDMNEGL
jgi:hypothetical protein